MQEKKNPQKMEKKMREREREREIYNIFEWASYV